MKGKSLRLYLYHKQKIAARNWKENNLNADHDINERDKLYKGLPFFEKLAKENEHKALIQSRIENSKSLPSLYLEQSRELGKNELGKKIIFSK